MKCYHSTHFQHIYQAFLFEILLKTKKRRVPLRFSSLSLLTSSPFASSGSLFFPQLIRKATHRRTSSRIQPFFLIKHPFPFGTFFQKFYLFQAAVHRAFLRTANHFAGSFISVHKKRASYSESFFSYIECQVMKNFLSICFI